MPEPWEWEEVEFLALIAQRAEESTELDFKRCAALDVSTGEARAKSKRELSKDVSAFANAAGGTIVYGVIERDHVAVEIDEGFDPNAVTREWIEQVINGSVHPRVAGVRVKTVELRQTRPGRVGYVVHLPQGNTAHQASDNVYYRRHGTECLPMEDYAVRDVMQRAVAPRLTILANIDGQPDATIAVSVQDEFIQTPQIAFSVNNDENSGVAEYSQFQVFTPQDASPVDTSAIMLLSSGQIGRTAITSLTAIRKPSSSGARYPIGTLRSTSPLDNCLCFLGKVEIS